MWIAETHAPDIPIDKVHNYLWAFFPSLPPGARRPFLWRFVDGRIVMLCAERPTFPHDAVAPEAGRAYGFEAILKPMNTSNRKPHLIVGPEARRAWMARNLVGADMGYVHVEDLDTLTMRKTSGERMLVPGMKASGVLTVTDAADFTRFLLRGWSGHGKSLWLRAVVAAGDDAAWRCQGSVMCLITELCTFLLGARATCPHFARSAKSFQRGVRLRRVCGRDSHAREGWGRAPRKAPRTEMGNQARVTKRRFAFFNPSRLCSWGE